jgi:phosphoglycolate phosphatase/putative hydrolase of the HAD superfamily
MRSENLQNRLDINWSVVKVVIFDVDGTLYDQHKLQNYMLKELLRYYITHPLHLIDLKILYDFRREREKHVFDVVNDIENKQYNWAAKASGVSIEKARCVVQKWIFKIPLRYIRYCRYPGVLEFFDSLRLRGIKTAIFSDYPAEEKIDALGLCSHCVVCASDRYVDRFKPNPKGLNVIAETMGIPVENCLFIGDRDDRDGECARKVGMQYMIVGRKHCDANNRFQTYQELTEHLSLFRHEDF